MKQLQYRTRPYIGQIPCTATDWKIYAEARIVTKDMRLAMKESGTVSGDEQYRLVDTKTQPELVMVWDEASKTYQQPGAALAAFMEMQDRNHREEMAKTAN